MSKAFGCGNISTVVFCPQCLKSKGITDKVYIYECKILWSLLLACNISHEMFSQLCAETHGEKNVKITSECEAVFLRCCGPFSALPQFLMVR